MSKGPGTVERKVAELFRASGTRGTDRSFTVAELCREVFGITDPTRVHRVSVARAARTAIRRAQAVKQRRDALWDEAWAEAVAKFGEPKRGARHDYDSPFNQFLDAHPGRRLFNHDELVHWCATAMADGSLVFHHFMRPARVWAVAITRDGLVWSEAQIVEVTRSRISVAYKGVRAPLRRPLNPFGSWWRGVRFVGERDGIAAEWLEQQWREQFGHLFPDLMPLTQARQLLGLPDNYTEQDVICAFRKAAKCCHPDMGGTAEQFRELVKARDRLLAALGTSAPPPKEPDFTPRGYRTVYRTVRNHAHRRIGGGRPLLAGQV